MHRNTTNIGINRRLPDSQGRVDFGWHEAGPYDPEVRILAARAEDGSLLGVLVNHGCHPICLPPWNRRASADWVGAMRRRVEAVSGAPCFFMQGAAADISPRHEWVPKWGRGRNPRGPHAAATDAEACAVLGEGIAEDVLAALEGRGEPIEGGPVRAETERVLLALQSERDTGGDPMPYYRGVDRERRLPRWLVDALLDHAFPWVTEMNSGPEGVTRVPLSIYGLRVGGLLIAAHGSEPFSQTGSRIVRDSPSPHTLFAGYANAMIGYIPTRSAIPGGGYEVQTAPYLYRLPGLFTPEAEPRACVQTLALLERLMRPDS